MKDPRFDFRSEERFRLEIKARTKRERELLAIYEENVEKLPTIFMGCGPDGEYLSLDEVHTLPDMVGVEIKYTTKETKYVHFKVYQIMTYIGQKAKILFFVDTPPKIKYAWLDPEWISEHPIVIYWQKECFEVPMDEIQLIEIGGENEQFGSGEN